MQRRTEAAGKHFSLCDQLADIALRHRCAGQIAFQQSLIAKGAGFFQILRFGKVQTAGTQVLLKLLKQHFLPRSGQVHFVDKHKGGHLIFFQQPPQSHRMGLDAVGGADEQHGAVQNRHGPLCFGGKIHVSGGVHQGHRQSFRFQQRQLGKDGNAPGTFQLMVIKQGISMIHPSQLPLCTGAVKHRLRQRGLTCIHMSQQTSTNMRFFRLFTHAGHPFHCFFTGIIARKYPPVDRHSSFGAKF